MLCDELLCYYKSASGKISAEGGVCDNRSINYCNKSVNTNETPLGQNQLLKAILSMISSMLILYWKKLMIFN